MGSAAGSMRLVMIVSFRRGTQTMLTVCSGWMTAQVFVKLSSKLAAEQGIVGGFDGTLDSAPATPEEAIETRLSSGFQRAPSTEKKPRQESKHKSKKRSFGSSTGSTM